MTHDSQEDICEEVRACSQRWIKRFNEGDADYCIAAYTQEAVINAKPMGTFTGTDEIAGFWRPFITSGAGELEYIDTKLQVVNDSTVLLSANWRMNVGRGIITMEKWGKQPDGNWLLDRDDFEVLEKFAV